ncbi:hypothetical protein [Streptomyces sp. ALI-76-A]|uniref:hypothetical protein n=1 Tax=Streptomyces sp. ALI-76-A TaxID=3025736 RepID=UPI00256F4F78|nr:hypothetical protein [Streptomyces sp. ALI-76-A]MDL5205890.1 hypothetical protein [Streptomyces sp. ALI-76-A]
MTSTAFEHGTPQTFVDPYAADTSQFPWPHPADRHPDTDYLLPPPNPTQRLTPAIDPRDRRRLDLHAALTAAGVPPHPEDRHAIDQISALPADINDTLQRWLHHTT